MTEERQATAVAAPTNAMIWTLGAMTAASAVAVDIAIPAQPDIARALGAAPEAGGALVGSYLIGYAAGQLLWGPVSDRYGRIGPLVVALTGFVLTAVGCALAQNLDLLIALRVVQGVMGGGVPTIARAIARDQGGGMKTAKLLANMTVILGAAPLLAPIAGAGLLLLFPWQALFWSLALFGLLLLLAIATVLRPLPMHRGDKSMSPPRALLAGLPLFRESDFLFGLGIGAAIFFGYAAFLAAGATLIEEAFGLTAEAFGPLFALVALAFIAGSSTARARLPRWGARKTISLAVGLVSAAGLLFGAFTLLHPVALPVLWLTIALFTYAFGLMIPTATAIALEPAGGRAGVAASYLGTIGALCGAAGAIFVSLPLFAEVYDALCATLAISCLLVLVIWFSIRRRDIRKRL